MKRSTFAALLVAILACYLAVEVAYAMRAPRISDEFLTAYTVRQFESKLAYREFDPPKTVLAFYLLLPPLRFVRDAWNAMTAAKIELALFNAAALALAAVALRRRIDARAVLAALGLLVVMTNFLERSCELRNDPIAALFGLLALIALMTEHPFLAGLASAASFLSTQKGIYFPAAAELALAALVIRDRSRAAIRTLLAFNAAAAAALAAYIAFWAALSSLHAVMTSIFFNANVKAIALQNLYDIRGTYWMQTLTRNPFFYALAALGLIVLAPRWLKRAGGDVIVPYAIALIAFSIWHRQPWPYFFVMLAPTLFVLHAQTLDQVILPMRQQARRAFLFAFVSTGILFPLARLPHALSRDNGFQHAMFESGQRLLRGDDTYLDAVCMLYRREQALQRLAWVDAAGLQRLQQMSERDLMEIAAALERTPPKLLIWNYHLNAFPLLLKSFLLGRYAPLYGDIFFYAPAVAPPRFHAAFAGNYVVDGGPAFIDGTALQSRSVIRLTRGLHTLNAAGPIRLRLMPPPGIEVDPDYIEPRDLFADVYTF